MILSLGGAPVVAASPVENTTITVSSDVRTTPSNPRGEFKGFGINGADLRSYKNTPKELRDKCIKLFWQDLDLRIFRIWGGDLGADKIWDTYRLYLEDIKNVRAAPLLILGGDATMNDINDPLHSWNSQLTEQMLKTRVLLYANSVKELWTKHQLRIDYVEIANEPAALGNDWKPTANWSTALTLTKMWRKTLDSLGLQDVKILAASKPFTDAGDEYIVDGFKADPTAFSAWGGYSYHAYGIGMRKALRDKLAGVDRDIFQTESGEPITRGAAHAISDINLGANYWLQFEGYEWVDWMNYTIIDSATRLHDTASGEHIPSINGVELATFDHYAYAPLPGMDVRLFAIYFYLRELARMVPVGSRAHLCTTNRTETKFKYMEMGDGQRPPIVAAGVEQPDGRWGLVVHNSSTNEPHWDNPYPATTQNVTFNVPELAGKGSMVFKVRKIKPNKDTLNLPNQTMKNGVIQVDSLLVGEMVTLQSVDVPTGLARARVPQASWTRRGNDLIVHAFPNASVHLYRLDGSAFHGTTDRSGEWSFRTVGNAMAILEVNLEGSVERHKVSLLRR